MFEIQVLESSLRPANSETLEMGPHNLVPTFIPGDSNICEKA